ncbi:MAG: hypothetical protein Q8J90_10235 [Gallionella sp.]|nr:hypothetical protein [Gallionella sp.]
MRKTSNTFVLAALLLYFCNGLVSLAHGHSLVFGPEFFSSESGKPQRVVKRFSVHDVNQKFFVSIQNGMSSESRAASGTVSINGKLVVTPDELGKQFKILTKPVTLEKKNEILVEVTGDADASIIVTIMSLEKRTVTVTVPPIGEAVDLKGYALAIFPADAFDIAQKVTISVTTSPSIQDVFEAHAAGPRLPYEIRINTGNKAPEKDIAVSLNHPESFFESNYQVHMFARMHDNPDDPDVHDRFYRLSSGVDDIVMTTKAVLPKHAFSNRYGKNGTFEAVITVGLIH